MKNLLEISFKIIIKVQSLINKMINTWIKLKKLLFNKTVKFDMYSTFYI